jgi:hypothetical protein
MLNYQYTFGNFRILQSEYVRVGVYVLTLSNIFNVMMLLFLFFPLHVIKLLGIITFSFSAIDSLLMLYFTSIRTKLEYASVAWNSVTVTDSSEHERV